MLSRGYLPTTVNPHRTVVDFTREGLGGKYDDLLRRFNRMRRKRHDFIYDSENATTDQEVRDAIKAAQDLIRGIRGSLADPLPLS